VENPNPQEVSARARWSFAALLALAVLLAVNDLWALNRDQVFPGGGAYLGHLIQMDLQSPFWPALLSAREPVAPLLALLLIPLAGSAWIAAGLLGLLCHLTLLFQCHALGRRLGGTHRAGLLAAAMCGLNPAVYGWTRGAHHEIVVAVVVALALQIISGPLLARRPLALLALIPLLAACGWWSWSMIAVFWGDGLAPPPLSRLALPALPPLSVLAALALCRVLDRLPRALSPAVAWGVVAALLGALVGGNLGGGNEQQPSRMALAARMSPDPRPFRGFPKAARAMGRKTRKLSWAHDTPEARELSAGVEVLWRSQGVDLVTWPTPAAERDRPFPLILVRSRPDAPLTSGKSEASTAWLLQQKDARRIWTGVDPDGLVYQAYWVGK